MFRFMCFGTRCAFGAAVGSKDAFESVERFPLAAGEFLIYDGSN